MCGTLGTRYVLAKSGVAVSHTGDTNETALATVPLPANAMGPNGVLFITAIWSYTNSANNKIMRTRLGGISGTVFGQTTATTSAVLREQREIHNRNSASSQVGFQLGSGGWITSSSALATASIDTTSAQDIVLSALLANSGETITLEAYVVEVIYGA